MITVKVVKKGNSTMITIPSSYGVKEGEEFVLIKNDNGAITMIPKIEDYFKSAKEGEFYTTELDVGFVPTEKEIDGF